MFFSQASDGLGHRVCSGAFNDTASLSTGPGSIVITDRLIQLQNSMGKLQEICGQNCHATQHSAHPNVPVTQGRHGSDSRSAERRSPLWRLRHAFGINQPAEWMCHT